MSTRASAGSVCDISTVLVLSARTVRPSKALLLPVWGSVVLALTLTGQERVLSLVPLTWSALTSSARVALWPLVRPPMVQAPPA